MYKKVFENDTTYHKIRDDIISDIDDEFEMSTCGSCNEEFYLSELIDCPSGYFEDNKWISARYCKECCIESLEDGDCEGECGEDFVEDWRRDRFIELFNDNDFIKKEDFVYYNKSKTVAFGYIFDKRFENLKNISKKIKKDDFVEVSNYYKGDIILLIKLNNKLISYDIEYITFAENIFKLARKKNLGYSWWFYSDGNLLLIESQNMWCLIAPYINLELGEEEKRFNERIIKGVEFFDIKVTDKLGWSVIKDDEFEDLCFDLLTNMKEFENVKKTGGGSGELCEDISAVEKYKTLDGVERIKWTIQCKHFSSRNVNQSDIPNLFNVCDAHKSDGVFIITSGKVSPGLKRTILAFNESDSHRFRARWWEKQDLVNHLEKYQDMLKKYFFKK